MELVEGKLYEVVVQSIIDKVGAVVLFEDDDTALVHISNIADEYVKDIRDYIDVNQTLVAYCQVGKVKPLELSFKHLKLYNRNETRGVDRYVPTSYNDRSKSRPSHSYLDPYGEYESTHQKRYPNDRSSKSRNNNSYRPSGKIADSSRNSRYNGGRSNRHQSQPKRQPSLTLDEMIELSNKDFVEKMKPSKNRKNKRR